jgi:hypothetical protein
MGGLAPITDFDQIREAHRVMEANEATGKTGRAKSGGRAPRSARSRPRDTLGTADLTGS